MNATLRQARIIWAALMTGQAAFGGVVWYLLQSGEYSPSGGPVDVYGPIAWIAMIGSLLGAVFVRSRASRMELAGRAIPPAEWLRSRILCFALPEGAVLLSLAFLLITGELTPFAMTAVIGFLFGLGMYPVGAPSEGG